MKTTKGLNTKFKNIFGFELEEVLLDFGNNLFLLDTKAFMFKAFDGYTARTIPKRLVDLVKDKYGEEASVLIQEVLNKHLYVKTFSTDKRPSIVDEVSAMIVTQVLRFINKFSEGYQKNQEKKKMKEYIKLLESYFVNETLTTANFEEQFLKKFKEETIMLPEKEFQILDRLFGDIDSPGENTEEQLKQSVGKALLELQYLNKHQ